MFDTICSIATTLGVGAISIIRVSGKEAISIVNNIFKGKVPGHKILPILKLTLSIIMLFLGYSILTNICLVAIIVQNLIILKKY